MKLEVEVNELDVIGQPSYAYELLKSVVGVEATEEPAHDGKCKVVDDRGIKGVLDLMNLTIELENGEETDVNQQVLDSGRTMLDIYDDLGPYSALVWGVDTSGGEPVNVLFGVN